MGTQDRTDMALGQYTNMAVGQARTSPFTHVSVEASFEDAQEVTPDDGADLPRSPAPAFRVGGAGDVVVTTVGGSEATLVGLAAGETVRIGVTRIHATGTTATAIVALYY